MDIWIASLYLRPDGNDSIDLEFKFKKEDEQYEDNKYRSDEEWVSSSCGWTCKRVSKTMEVKERYGVYVVEQGFNKDLTYAEIYKVESEMKRILVDYLKQQRDMHIKAYNNKIKYLKNIGGQ